MLNITFIRFKLILSELIMRLLLIFHLCLISTAFAVAFLLLLSSPNAIAQDEEMVDVPPDRFTVVKPSLHSCNIIILTGVGTLVSLNDIKFGGPIILGGIEIPVSSSGNISVELDLKYIYENDKRFLDFEDLNPQFLVYYGFKFYLYESQNSRFSFRIGSWGIPLICFSYGIEYDYVFNSTFELGASIYMNGTLILGPKYLLGMPPFITTNLRIKM